MPEPPIFYFSGCRSRQIQNPATAPTSTLTPRPCRRLRPRHLCSPCPSCRRRSPRPMPLTATRRPSPHPRPPTTPCLPPSRPPTTPRPSPPGPRPSTTPCPRHRLPPTTPPTTDYLSITVLFNL